MVIENIKQELEGILQFDAHRLDDGDLGHLDYVSVAHLGVEEEVSLSVSFYLPGEIAVGDRNCFAEGLRVEERVSVGMPENQFIGFLYTGNDRFVVTTVEGSEGFMQQYWSEFSRLTSTHSVEEVVDAIKSYVTDRRQSLT